jgi:thiol-disulfide isomerase/thioredoxin
MPPVDSVAIPAETAPRKKPTWRELTEQNVETKASSTMPISSRRRTATEVAADSTNLAASRPVRGLSGFLGGRGRAESGEADRKPQDFSVLPASCQFDAKRQRLVDFRLPDLDGKPIRFQDLDAEYVLLDFWGTWCKPCRDSIPHLVELQTRYGPKTLRVLGVATEHGASAEQQAKNVDAVSKSLNVNYPVLLSEADGKPCPLQEALHVQAYPTMILVDRTGKILWRGMGAELTTLSRLDRVIASRADSAVVRR